jgi:transglutaminase-like putative cysteine protease
MGRSAVRTAPPVEQFFQYSLLGLLASGYFAFVGSGSVDLPTIVLTGAGLLFRFLLITGLVDVEVDARWTTAATVGYVGFYPLDILYVSGEFIPATVHLICFLAVVRILTARTDRDYFFVKVIAFLELLAATLLSSSLNFFFFLLLFLTFGVATFCCSEIRRSGRMPSRRVVYAGPFHRRLAVMTAGMTVGIVVLTGGLFFLLPRTARAAFRSLVAERYHLPGFSNEVTLGQIGELKSRSTPVMHVRIDAPHSEASVKWRGAALGQFDGKRWYNPPVPPEKIRIRPEWNVLASDEQRRRPGPRLTYEVRLGIIDSDALFFAGIPESVQIEGLPLLLRKAGDSYASVMSLRDQRSYRATSHIPEAGPDVDFPIHELTEEERTEYLLLPPVSRRIIELARTTGVGATTLDRARAIESYLRRNYGYTTELLKKEADDPLGNFLFERRKGHCEYFASSMAVMLRAIHIPSRVATGFQSGTYNPMTGWHVIRASDAHSWVEAWIPGRGWTTFDPTPPDFSQTRGLGAFWNQVMLYVDTAETLWQQWVIQYDLKQQIDLVSRVGRRSRNLNGAWLTEAMTGQFAHRWTGLAKMYVPWVVAAGALLALFAFVLPWVRRSIRARRDAARIARGQVHASDAAILYARMLAILRRRGLEKPAWLTPNEFAEIVPDSPITPIIDRITRSYHDLRYAGDTTAGPRMVQLLQELESTK